MIFTIDTSSSLLSLALATEDARVIEAVSREATPAERGVHDARLAIEVEALLSKHAVSPREISCIAIIIGPGSFTGLRIGLAFAKGFSFACDCRIVPLTQHEVLAYQFPQAKYLVTPGYQPKLVYLASRNSIQEIALLDEAGYLAVAPEAVFGLAGNYPPFVRYDGMAAIDPAAMAALSASKHPLRGAEIDELEPRYITEFNTGKTERP